MATKILLTSLLALSSALASAQGTVYETRDKAGPVFSDQPTSGAKALSLPPLENNSALQAPPQIQEQLQQQAVASYSQLTIIAPEDLGTIHTNSGAFDIQLQIQPEFDPKSGATISVKLDGKPLARGFRSSAIQLTEEDWAQAATSDNIEHSLQVAIVDQIGNLLIESAPVWFYAHRATVDAEAENEAKTRREARREARRKKIGEAIREGDHVTPHVTPQAAPHAR